MRDPADDVAARLAAHAAAARFANLPAEAVARAKVFILDTLGVGIAGSTAQGAAAALANLRGLDAARTLAVLGIQYGQTAGTMQAHVEGSPVLPLQVGMNARAALQAADLEAAGLPGLAAPFTGRHGYLRLMEFDDFDRGDLLESLGTRWLIAEFAHKPYPSGRATHGGAEGVLALRAAHGITPEQVAEVGVTAPPLIHRLVNRPDLSSPSPNYARLCMPFVVAKALLEGEIRLDQFRGAAALEDKATHALAARVRMEPDGSTDENALVPQSVTLRLTDGRVLRHDIPAMRAAATRPLTQAEHLAKFRGCCDYAAAPLGAARADALIALVEGLEAVADCRDLAALLAPQGE